MIHCGSGCYLSHVFATCKVYYWHVRAMLLLDSVNLVTYEVEEEKMKCWRGKSVPIPFEWFESTARSHQCSGFLASQYPSRGVRGETLVFLRMVDGKGWAWASSISVLHQKQFPIEETLIGNEFLFIWPVAMAFNAYLNLREHASRDNTPTTQFSEFMRAIEDHPPTLGFVPGSGTTRIDTVRQIPVEEMTVAQRLFVASLAPQIATFSTRTKCDTWSENLMSEDKHYFDRFVPRGRGVAPPPRVCDSQKYPCVGGGVRTNAGPPASHTRRKNCRKAPFDLPDDAVERFVCMCIGERMESMSDMQDAASNMRLVNRQFRRAVDATLQHLVHTVGCAARSLLGDRPREPKYVQEIVHAAGLTLRFALTLDTSWLSYIRGRRQVEMRASTVPGPVLVHSAHAKQQLLWNVHLS